MRGEVGIEARIGADVDVKDSGAILLKQSTLVWHTRATSHLLP